ncbi:MAG: sulfatase-like hydrolase/transferase, partial [Spirochaetota bacterium]
MSASRAPNILFLIADQQQRPTVAPGSPCLMPRLGRLRDSGFWFPNAHTVNSICAPARASLMTGLYPHNHGMVDNPHAVEEFRSNFQAGRDMISARLKASGYRLGYFGKWHVERGL